MSALDLYGAPEGAHTKPRHDLTSAESSASPESVGTSAEGNEFRLGDIDFTDLCIVFVLGGVTFLGAAWILFVATQVVVGWFSP